MRTLEGDTVTGDLQRARYRAKEAKGHMGIVVDDSESVSVSSMEIVTQVVD